MRTDIDTETQTVTDETYDSCVEKIRSFYGSNYAIVNKKRVKVGGIGPFFKKDAVEVKFVILPEKKQYMGYQSYSRTPSNTADDFERERQKIVAENKINQAQQMQAILSEVQSLRAEIGNVKTSSDGEHETIVKIRDLMEDNEFTPSFIRSIVERIRKEYSLDDLEDFERVKNSVVDWIGESIKIESFQLKSRPQVVILVGPTGIGKTTTIAKIAAKYACPSDFSARRLNVRMLTVDTFRIAARQQLQIYGDILEVPVEVIEQSGDLPQKVAAYGTDVDLVLIDTIGYSPKDYEHIAKMKKLLELQGKSAEVFLAMSATTKTSDMREIMQQFEIFGYNSIIFTKLDETSHIGNIISLTAEKNKSMLLFTTGQKVPRDIEKASVLKLLMLLSDFNIDREHIEEAFPVGNN